ncbi:GHKL domain-containing protein [Paenibacillus soyae]|uniref:GHKL domain-containing protein n=1 Tax=Paenibacillus soyae TaxID=2969249 RepID=A0A9X2S8G8_9BACL|nr:GHKL domain-containing protein [Paenibacillus soyae]MCR2804036.1 GHKL domain-containing protein [Paenibacillus soyae]
MRHNPLHLKNRIVFFVVAILILAALTCSKLYFSYHMVNQSAEIAVAKQYIGIAQRIADGLDKELYGQFLQTKQYGEDRDRISLYLKQFREPTGALFVYILMLDETNVAKAMVSSIPDGVPDLPIGGACTVPAEQVNEAKQGKSYYTGIIQDEAHYGNYLSVGVPFYDENGEIMGVVGIDVSAENLDKLGAQVVKSNGLVFSIDILFAVFLLGSVFFLNKWYKRRLRSDLKESESVYITELGKVIEGIKLSRHDMMNHLQVLRGLLEMKYYDRAIDYLKRMSVDSKSLDLSMRIKNPVLLVLFQSKWELAHSKNIAIDFDTDQNEYNRVDAMDLVKICSNLLDNAIEATDVYAGEHPRAIRVICKAKRDRYIFAVENPAELSPKEQKSLFEQGYTTKFSPDKLRGNGLTIIKRTVEKYNGSVHVHCEDGKVFIQVTI